MGADVIFSGGGQIQQIYIYKSIYDDLVSGCLLIIFHDTYILLEQRFRTAAFFWKDIFSDGERILFPKDHAGYLYIFFQSLKIFINYTFKDLSLGVLVFPCRYA